MFFDSAYLTDMSCSPSTSSCSPSPSSTCSPSPSSTSSANNDQYWVYNIMGVDPNSTNPFSDYMKRINPNWKQKPGGVKRPSNSFIFYSQERRREISQLMPDKQQNSISVDLGKEWKELPEEEKDLYRKKSKALGILHSLEWPEYKFCPKKDAGVDGKKAKANKKAESKAHDHDTRVTNSTFKATSASERLKSADADADHPNATIAKRARLDIQKERQRETKKKDNHMVLLQINQNQIVNQNENQQLLIVNVNQLSHLDENQWAENQPDQMVENQPDQMVENQPGLLIESQYELQWSPLNLNNDSASTPDSSVSPPVQIDKLILPEEIKDEIKTNDGIEAPYLSKEDMVSLSMNGYFMDLDSLGNEVI